jgi:hypothetical protein
MCAPANGPPSNGEALSQPTSRRWPYKLGNEATTPVHPPDEGSSDAGIKDISPLISGQVSPTPPRALLMTGPQGAGKSRLEVRQVSPRCFDWSVGGKHPDVAPLHSPKYGRKTVFSFLQPAAQGECAGRGALMVKPRGTMGNGDRGGGNLTHEPARGHMWGRNNASQ